ncbi:hypothetical protein [Paractinoplanes toevensis]|uniref:Uncharacterized protein n=1 Tax=Paractinoplanes toevensis TaxID=571911 RepID=A0A919T9H7_9ACTN|nr:hypothetical protein [Actinoplanes toevensis]GIM90340.1 hypothetical protein Ato02nite_021330 [Actinoplanes toevensis]
MNDLNLTAIASNSERVYAYIGEDPHAAEDLPAWVVAHFTVDVPALEREIEHLRQVMERVGRRLYESTGDGRPITPEFLKVLAIELRREVSA